LFLCLVVFILPQKSANVNFIFLPNPTGRLDTVEKKGEDYEKIFISCRIVDTNFA